MKYGRVALKNEENGGKMKREAKSEVVIRKQELCNIAHTPGWLLPVGPWLRFVCPGGVSLI